MEVCFLFKEIIQIISFSFCLCRRVSLQFFSIRLNTGEHQGELTHLPSFSPPLEEGRLLYPGERVGQNKIYEIIQSCKRTGNLSCKNILDSFGVLCSTVLILGTPKVSIQSTQLALRCGLLKTPELKKTSLSCPRASLTKKKRGRDRKRQRRWGRQRERKMLLQFEMTFFRTLQF